MPIHHRKPNRLKGYDYNQPGYYFITLTTKNRLPYFGKIVDGSIRLNNYGILAQNSWENIPTHYANVNLDVFAILPDHIHGIIIIGEATNVVTEHCSVTTGLLSKIIQSYKGNLSLF